VEEGQEGWMGGKRKVLEPGEEEWSYGRERCRKCRKI